MLGATWTLLLYRTHAGTLAKKAISEVKINMNFKSNLFKRTVLRMNGDFFLRLAFVKCIPDSR